MEFKKPITDRKQYDIVMKTPKGHFNVSDVNRIESNCAYLAGQLNGYGYSVSIQAKTDWTMQDIPYQSEIDRIRDNVNMLIDAYHKLQGSPDIRYWDSLNWQDANSLERNIKNIDTLLLRMISGFRYCGTFFSGQEVILP